MKNSMMKMMFVGVLALVMSGICSASITPLTNGGFEDPVVPAGGLSLPVVPDWTITGATYWHLYDAASLIPGVAEGNQALYLFGGSAFQEFGVVEAGETYTVTFSAAMNPGMTAWYSEVVLVDIDLDYAPIARTNLGEVIIGDVANQWFNGSVTYDSATYAHVMGHRIGVQVNSGTQLLVDNFAVVPEPMTMVLLGLGGMMIRRKRSV